MKLDILVLAAHPDDAEISCGATIAKHIALGKKIGVVDLTRGELGTRGTAEIRDLEAKASAKVLGLSVRENLGLRDGFFQNSEEDQLKVVTTIRKHQPEIVLTNAVHDRHPDHGRASELVYHATFLSGLAKVETKLDGKAQLPWRPKSVYHFIQSLYINPDFVIDVSDFWEKKMESLRAYKSQFYDPQSKEPETFISNPGFMKLIETRGHELGYTIGARYGEGFTVRRHIGVNDIFDLI
ncbi:MAG: bacillithiol biosynthesis deacetylase BshB1 [Bacteroidetes bacterium]|nr:bacillithiol biosynthesis deacetylase BshB1 [Bacteroidota bacterium]MBI3481645.1 bacillithiol biosynthesis deacetylase BshB1 [Bacteroidota bacterium]